MIRFNYSETELERAWEIARVRRPNTHTCSDLDKRMARAEHDLHAVTERHPALLHWPEIARFFGYSSSEFIKRKYQFLHPRTFQAIGVGMCPVSEFAWQFHIDRQQPTPEVAQQCLYGRGPGQSGIHLHQGVYLTRSLDGVMLVTWTNANIDNATGKRVINRHRNRVFNQLELLDNAAQKLLTEGR